MTTFASVEPPRDQWGRYIITPAAGGKAKGHIRATTWAKTCADEGGLTRWKQRMVAQGLVARPDLFATVASLDVDDKKRLDQVCSDAMEAAEASSGRNLGTALHSFTEQVDRGLEPVIPPPHDTTIAAYTQAMKAAGVTVVPNTIERVCVRPDITVAGTFDRLVHVPGRRLPMVADIKTGQSVTYGGGEWSIQLALYATAETLWDPATDTHTPMPEVDQEHALIIHMPSGGTTCTLHYLDIAAGSEMIDVCGTVRDWRNRSKHLITALDVSAAPTPATPASNNHDADQRTVERRDWLVGRITTLLAEHPAAADDLARLWPAGVPTFREAREAGAVHQPRMLDQVADLLVEIEAAHGVAFADTNDPAGPLPVNDEQITAAVAALKALPADLAEQVTAAAVASDVPKLTGGTATIEHIETLRDLIEPAATEVAERRSMIAASVAVLGDDVTIGWLWQAAGIPTQTEWDDVAPTAQQVSIIGDLCDASQLGLLVADGNGGLRPADGALDALVEHHGGKGPLLTEAKRIAERLGITKPRSSADVVASTVLTASVAVAEPTAA